MVSVHRLTNELNNILEKFKQIDTEKQQVDTSKIENNVANLRQEISDINVMIFNIQSQVFDIEEIIQENLNKLKKYKRWQSNLRGEVNNNTDSLSFLNTVVTKHSTKLQKIQLIPTYNINV